MSGQAVAGKSGTTGAPTGSDVWWATPPAGASGNKRRSKRVRSALETLDALMFYDVVYVGGGNARHVTVDLGPKARTIDNRAGMLGGIKLWERRIT